MFKLQIKTDEDLTAEEDGYYDADLGIVQKEQPLGHHPSDKATVVTHGSLVNFCLEDVIIRPQTSNIASCFPGLHL